MTKKQQKKEDTKKLITLLVIVATIMAFYWALPHVQDERQFTVNVEEIFAFVIVLMIVCAGFVMLLGFVKLGAVLLKLAVFTLIIVTILTLLVH